MTTAVKLCGSVFAAVTTNGLHSNSSCTTLLFGVSDTSQSTALTDSAVASVTTRRVVKIYACYQLSNQAALWDFNGSVEKSKLAALIKLWQPAGELIGWVRTRSGSTGRPSWRERRVHHSLRQLASQHVHNDFIFGLCQYSTESAHTLDLHLYQLPSSDALVSLHFEIISMKRDNAPLLPDAVDSFSESTQAFSHLFERAEDDLMKDGDLAFVTDVDSLASRSLQRLTQLQDDVEELERKYSAALALRAQSAEAVSRGK